MDYNVLYLFIAGSSAMVDQMFEVLSCICDSAVSVSLIPGIKHMLQEVLTTRNMHVLLTLPL